MVLVKDQKITLSEWLRSGDPFIWINASAVSISVVAVIGLLLLLAVRGFGHFWPADVLSAQYTVPGGQAVMVAGEIVETEDVPIEQLIAAGVDIDSDQALIRRSLVKQGNRDVSGVDFVWLIDNFLSEGHYPKELVAIERREWGNFYGYITGLKESGRALGLSLIHI